MVYVANPLYDAVVLRNLQILECLQRIAKELQTAVI